MKPSKMLELVENLKVGEKVVIEKFKDHLFVEKKCTESSENINKHGVDLSIMNDEDWFYVETKSYRWIVKGNLYSKGDKESIHFNLDSYNLWNNPSCLCEKDEITLLRKATPEDLAPFFEEYPQYAPVKVGDIGIFYDDLKEHQEKVEVSDFNLGSLKCLNDGLYPYISRYNKWEHFFKVSENETIAEIKERFLKENGL